MELDRDENGEEAWGKSKSNGERASIHTRGADSGIIGGDDDDDGQEEEDLVSSTMDQTGFLLQRLQDLKRWQKEQEMRLLRDQQKQMADLQRGGSTEDSPDEDATIDQDVSSLTSFEELPRSDQHSYSYSTNFEDDEEDAGRPNPAPSWACRSRTESDDPKTVLNATGSRRTAIH